MKIRTSCSLSSFGSVRYLQDNNWQIYRQNECNTNYNYMSLHVSLSSHKNNFHTGVILLGDAKLISFRFILVLLRKRLKNINFFKQYVSTLLFFFFVYKFVDMCFWYTVYKYYQFKLVLLLYIRLDIIEG